MTAPTATQNRPMHAIFSRPSLARLTRVELRKACDTRAGLWLLIAISAATVAIELITLFTASENDQTFDAFFSLALGVQALMIPVLGILLVTSEWTQRTGLVTFTLEPVRSRVATAKVTAACVLTFAALLFALGVGALVTLVGGHGHAWDLSFGGFGDYSLLAIIHVAQGLAFGMLLMNSAAAIVSFFVVPAVWAILFGSWHALNSVKSWIDLTAATEPLSKHTMTASAWAHLVVAGTIWVAIPFAFGLRRLLRTELK